MTTRPSYTQDSPPSSVNREDELLLLSVSSPSLHKKTNSHGVDLTKFDPLLMGLGTNKSDRESKVWSTSVPAVDDYEHPLFANKSNPASKGLPPRTKRRHRSHVSLGSAELAGVFRDTPPRDRGSTIDSDFRRLNLAPSSIPEKNEPKEKKKSHRQSNSISSLSELVRSIGGHSNSNPGTPQLSPVPPKKVKTPSMMLTPSKFSNSRNSSPKPVGSISPCPATAVAFNGLHLPLLAKPSPTSFITGSHDAALRTSEQDPAAHQMELPKVQELLVNAKFCSFLERFRGIDPDFPFSMLVGVSNHALKEFAVHGRNTLETAGFVEKHRPIVQMLLECEESVSVQGYAAQVSEVAIFDIPTRSQILVVFHGSNEQQLKPVHVKEARNCNVADNLHPDQKATVYPTFKAAYFELEAGVSALIDKLSDANPFANIVFSGTSFGGALATIGAVRYASNRPTIRVSAHVFGAPKVGAHNFRQLANSLSNLKVIRVENKDDAFVSTPIDNQTTKWEHVGHTISVGKSVAAYRFDNNKPPAVSHLAANPFRKVDRSSKAYCTTLENCVTKKLWVKAFQGEDIGDGVRGGNDEKRLMI
eukprot:CAMPEP_0119015598 /NCGR_PEP_ID=MMETSP1176-20130426/11277_1 /TAXON_ID=265551 /ORGANISM="Synedropsis recta cf, Strain CCMP1620" /LENGTH=587 /DNA_ID=CAMNT_0006968905 /DNA_START=131 /DNA_END=1894 /DNA_ORIENTATION=+